MSSQRRNRFEPPPDLRQLLARQGLSIAAAELAARMCRGGLSRVLAGRRGSEMKLPTAKRLARVLEVSLDVFAVALERTMSESKEVRRMQQAAELARLQAE